MATVLKMPKLGLTMTEGTVVKWNKQEGDAVENGELLYEVATDKINNDVESTVSGTLLKIIVPEGVKQQITKPVAVIGQPGEDFSELLEDDGASEAVSSQTEVATSQGQPAKQAVSEPTAVKELKASPLAKKTARENSLDLSGITGTGPDGRIVEKNVLAALSDNSAKLSPAAKMMAQQAGLDPGRIGKEGRIMKADIQHMMEEQALVSGAQLTETRIPMTQMRSIIAGRMLASVQTSPAVHYQMRVDVTEMKKFRDQVKQTSRITYTDMLIAITARVLLDHPLLNASLEGDEILVRNYVNMGVAVALEDGLMVPVIKNAHLKSFRKISHEISDLAAKAKGNNLTLEEMTGGTFTVTNLGMFGMESFTPIINQPEAAILGVNTITDTPVSENGSLVFRPMMNLNLTADHRIVDGAVAAAFMKQLKEAIENPLTLLW